MASIKESILLTVFAAISSSVQVYFHWIRLPHTSFFHTGSLSYALHAAALSLSWGPMDFKESAESLPCHRPWPFFHFDKWSDMKEPAAKTAGLKQTGMVQDRLWIPWIFIYCTFALAEWINSVLDMCHGNSSSVLLSSILFRPEPKCTT